MVRCTNIDVLGSFHPIISGQTHFKALSTGAAVAVSAPHHYCKRSLRNEPFNKPGDPMKMPVLAWYDNVNDLSRTWAVRFVDYAVGRVTAAEYRDWALETSKNYKQIGAIPGPFGCMTGNALSSSPQSCGYSETLRRNGVLERHLYTVPFDTAGFDMEAVKKELAPENRYFCAQRWKTVPEPEDVLKMLEGRKCTTPTGKCPTRKKIKGPDHTHVRNYSEQTGKFRGQQYSEFSRLKRKRLVNYLDPLCLKDESECDIRKVYPVIPISAQDGYVFRMLRQSDFQGFSIQSSTGFSSEDFGGFHPTGFRTPGGKPDSGVLFVNDELVCDKEGRLFTFLDFEAFETIRTTTQY